MKTLQRRKSSLTDSSFQISQLNQNSSKKFSETLKSCGAFPLEAATIDTLQINVGKLCNQVCTHCHVDAGPDRTEVMSRAVFDGCLSVLKNSDIRGVDLTGGAPEMNPDFRWFVLEVKKLNKKITVRSNLTVFYADAQYLSLPRFFKENEIHVISSLPCYQKTNTDKQRGVGVFEKSIRALQELNVQGYGTNPSLVLDLVYNPSGAFLPPDQELLERDYKAMLRADFGIEFNSLFAITNLPISRFLDFLTESGSLENYLETLISAFNPSSVSSLMCRNLISVGFDGRLYDCDFNQMMEMGVSSPSKTIFDWDFEVLKNRSVQTDQHCFGCTAGRGSSCGGQVV